MENSPNSGEKTATATPVVSCSLKRKRPPQIEIPNVLQEIQTDKLKFRDPISKDDAFSFSGVGVAVSAVKGKKMFMEDTHKIVSCLNGNPKKGFFGVYDGHGGKKAAKFVAENLHKNILQLMENCKENASKEAALKAAYLMTDQDFLKQGVVSGACCITVLVEGQELAVSNVGDCRAVLCKGGVAEALTRDHRAEQEDERKRIESKGGYVEIHRGAWRIHGVLSVSRSIGDAHLKDWVVAEPDSKIFQLTPEMEFLVLASDGLWEKVGNQEAVDTVTAFCMPEKKVGPMGGIPKNDDLDYGCVNVSPSSKLRRISLVKRPKIPRQSPKYKTVAITEEKFACENDNFPSENESPASKSRRISLVKRINTKTDSPTEENSSLKKKTARVGILAASKELVNLAVSRGSLDDITVMVIDLRHFSNS